MGSRQGQDHPNLPLRSAGLGGWRSPDCASRRCSRHQTPVCGGHLPLPGWRRCGVESTKDMEICRDLMIMAFRVRHFGLGADQVGSGVTAENAESRW